MPPLTYPVWTMTADNGRILDEDECKKVKIAVASVVDRDGKPIENHGVIVHRAGPDVSIEYDPAAKGEAWVRLELSTEDVFIGLTDMNARVAVYISTDAGRIDQLGGVAAALGNVTAKIDAAVAGFDRATARVDGFAWIVDSLTDRAEVVGATRTEVVVSGLTLPPSDLAGMSCWLIEKGQPINRRPISRVKEDGPNVRLIFAAPGFRRAPTVTDRVVVTR